MSHALTSESEILKRACWDTMNFDQEPELVSLLDEDRFDLAVHLLKARLAFCIAHGMQSSRAARIGFMLRIVEGSLV